MLKGFITLLVFQFLGESISKFFDLLVPGSVIGMLLLLGFLFIRKSSFKSLDSAVSIHLKYLPLLFIPAAMGIITQIDIIKKEFWAIFISLFFGTLIALAFSSKLMDYLTKKAKKDEF
ncbi:hypothetical protein AAX26_00256 [Aliarcobacter thereius]|uniref:CidA/LrgA family protein n=2 Tax=Aliarcobacter thereius TaxID=544718 RepID=A0A1C0B9L2_9BACT|nr:CidA/LrgA family protein [Aliarcobacter thereius]OCL88570.1 hypothetical protein AAX26_00256 [Aliarcobacter thereius]OCL92061.1 hypothetical protein AAX25_00791 [Aliarcobacter thereius]OCL94840.1 hypothetical protein AA347_00279 [Aliarcobacter thereius LMG 24486]OCM00287.1 hypothetical protein AAX29_00285 [Aliarcobacter thereius]QBF15286.1 murein hydrolase effector protein LrgA [Aliarcobacter thereius LMG 24486]